MCTEFTARDATAVAAEAFVFGFPLVLMDRLRADAPRNTLVHARMPAGRLAATEPTPCADALSTSAWLDVMREPIVLTVPETYGRYYVLTMLDMWTGMFASVGARSTGTGPGRFAIAGPGWQGVAIPPGVQPISAPTGDVRIVGKTSVERGPRFRAAHAVQDGYRLTPLSDWYGRDRPEPAAAATAGESGEERATTDATPADAVVRMGARAFFERLALLMRRNPPRAEDGPVVARIRALDLPGPDHGAVAAAIERGFRRGAAVVMAEARLPHGEPAGRWLVHRNLARHGTDYLRRAGAAAAGIGTTSPADELAAALVTDADGGALDGAHRYVLRFDPDESPPVHASWSLSSYDERHLLVGNRIDRYSIGDHSGLKLDFDGGLPVFIQAGPPERAGLSNWLPAPSGRFSLVLRLFWPRSEALDGAWTPPAVARVD